MEHPYSWLRKKSLNRQKLDRKTLSLGIGTKKGKRLHFDLDVTLSRL
jgi:hypothetical protein